MESSINESKENNKENESAKPNPLTEKIKSGKILYLHPKKLSKDSSPKIKQILIERILNTKIQIIF